MPSKRMHFEEDLVEELNNIGQSPADFNGIVHDLLEWWTEPGRVYSTSMHLVLMRQLCLGLNAKRIGEIGVGRSSFVLAATALDQAGEFVTCDRFDYREMFKAAEFDCEALTYIHGDSDKFWAHPETAKGYDFLFLDYMSSRKKSVESCYKDLKKAVKAVKQNGIIAVHDALPGKYNVAAALVHLQVKYNDGVEVLTLPYNYGLALIRRCTKSPHGEIKDTWPKTQEPKDE